MKKEQALERIEAIHLELESLRAIVSKPEFKPINGLRAFKYESDKSVYVSDVYKEDEIRLNTSFMVSITSGWVDKTRNYHNKSGSNEEIQITQEYYDQAIEALNKQGKDWNGKELVDKYVPKRGDFVYHSSCKYEYICILSEVKENSYRVYCGFSTYSGVFEEDGLCSVSDKIRPATEEEKQLLLSKMQEQGKTWDAEKKEVVDYRWRAELEGIYWSYNFKTRRSEDYVECNEYRDNSLYEIGGYFKTSAEAEAWGKEQTDRMINDLKK